MKFQSLLIQINNNIDQTQLNKFVKENTSINEEINELNSLYIRTDKNTIGIAALEDIQEWISLKSEEIRFVVIENAETLTTEAQNSLLKNLEEPPENTQFILLTKNSEKILETIRSRCLLIISKVEKIANEEYKELANKFINSNYLERLKISETIIKEYESREVISEIVFEIIKNYKTSENYKDKINTMKNIYIGIKSSVNLKICLDLLAIYLE